MNGRKDTRGALLALVSNDSAYLQFLEYMRAKRSPGKGNRKKVHGGEPKIGPFCSSVVS